MNKHTPGPWTANKTGYGSIWIGGNEIDDTGFQTEIGSICTEYGDMSKANARLIAAAPDLLAALRRLMSYDFGHSAGAIQARAAIEKATGEKLPVMTGSPEYTWDDIPF